MSCNSDTIVLPDSQSCSPHESWWLQICEGMSCRTPADRRSIADPSVSGSFCSDVPPCGRLDMFRTVRLSIGPPEISQRSLKVILAPGAWPGRKSSIAGCTAPSYRKTNWMMGFAYLFPGASGVAVGGAGQLPRSRRAPARPATGDNDKFWSCRGSGLQSRSRNVQGVFNGSSAHATGMSPLDRMRR